MAHGRNIKGLRNRFLAKRPPNTKTRTDADPITAPPSYQLFPPPVLYPTRQTPTSPSVTRQRLASPTACKAMRKTSSKHWHDAGDRNSLFVGEQPLLEQVLVVRVSPCTESNQARSRPDSPTGFSKETALGVHKNGS